MNTIFAGIYIVIGDKYIAYAGNGIVMNVPPWIENLD